MLQLPRAARPWVPPNQPCFCGAPKVAWAVLLGPGVSPPHPRSPVAASHLFRDILAAGLILAELQNHIS